MAFNGSKPNINDTKIGLLDNIRANLHRVAQMFQGGSGDASIPNDAKRIDNDGKLYKWDGSSWVLVANTVLLNETNMASDSTEQGVTQYSLKRFVENLVPSVSTPFACRNISSGSGSNLDGPLVGTGIDLGSDSWATSEFSLSFDSVFFVAGADGSASGNSGDQSGYSARLTGNIKKKSGSDPYARLIMNCWDTDNLRERMCAIFGTLSSASPTLSVPSLPDSSISSFSFSRVSSSNELCFQSNFAHIFGTQSMSCHTYIEGGRNYGGSDISPGEGTKF